MKGNRVEEYTSGGLQELYAYYINRLSYCEVENLVVRITGEKQLSDQGIWAGVSEKAGEISQKIVNQVQPTLEQLKDQKLMVNPQIDLYNAQQKEILLFEDGILVKGQKSERESRTELQNSKKKQLAIATKFKGCSLVPKPYSCITLTLSTSPRHKITFP